MRSPILDAPLALATDGTVMANVTHLVGDIESDDPQGLLDVALATGRPVLIAVALDVAEVDEAKGRLDDAAAEILATVVRS